MASPFTTPLPVYKYYEKAISQGAVLVFFGDFAAGAGEPGTGWTPVGLLEPDGIEYTHKPAFAEVTVAQLLRTLRANITKEDDEVKLTLTHVDPSVANVVRGFRPFSLTITPGTPTAFARYQQGLGEPAAIGSGGDIVAMTEEPNYEADYKQWVFLYNSPNFNFSTTPKAKWAYIRFYKGYTHSPSSTKHNYSKHATLNFTVKACADLSVSSPDNAGENFAFGPKVP